MRARRTEVLEVAPVKDERRGACSISWSRCCKSIESCLLPSSRQKPMKEEGESERERAGRASRADENGGIQISLGLQLIIRTSLQFHPLYSDFSQLRNFASLSTRFRPGFLPAPSALFALALRGISTLIAHARSSAVA